MSSDVLSAAIEKFRNTHVQQNGETPAQTERRADHAKWMHKLRTERPTTLRPKIVRTAKARIAEGRDVNNIGKLTSNKVLDGLIEDLGLNG